MKLIYTAWAVSAIAVHTYRLEAQPPKQVSVAGRVLDVADSVPLFGVVIEFEPVRGMPYARTDSVGRFTFRTTTRESFLTIRFHNGFYFSDFVVKEIPSSGSLDIGVVLLRRGPSPTEYAVVPWCEPVDRIPDRLPDGWWIQRDASSKQEKKLVACDGLLREPRVASRQVVTVAAQNTERAGLPRPEKCAGFKIARSSRQTEHIPYPQVRRPWPVDVSKATIVKDPLVGRSESNLFRPVSVEQVREQLKQYSVVPRSEWKNAYSHVAGGDEAGWLVAQDECFRWTMRPGGLAWIVYPDGTAVYLAAELHPFLDSELKR
jgi:hypothetical protein